MIQITGARLRVWSGVCLVGLVACGGGGGGTTVVAPAITTQPQSQTVTAPGATAFTVVATGDPAPSFQWNLGGNPIDGATSASYSAPTTLAMNGSSYTVTVTNNGGSVTSSPAILNVLSQDQANFESFYTAPAGGHEIYYVLPFTGSALSGA
jgi:hypothetical protein